MEQEGGQAAGIRMINNLDYKVTAFRCPDSKMYQKHKVKAKNNGAHGRASGLRVTSKSCPSLHPTTRLTEAHKLISSASGPELWEIPTATERNSQAEACLCSTAVAPAVKGLGTPAWNTFWADVWTRK